ncbi:hypothetical protein FE782_04060 [Paenibacillus antri]|uniref:Uncharacterized protein n=1 Tax=Paenibacillus antri TaxID=2582848 RepID=A0A5R9GKF3_9BACL|nr:hypothetical protein [Paenibacillus antri]TLS53453.1 hypothetical protein FE782_04060 [Paenibacillus antri]
MSLFQHELAHVYWIGGSPCAGKSTVARRLSGEYGFRYYKCDDCYDDHMARSTAERHPAMYSIKDFTWNQVWSSKFCAEPVDRQIRDVIAVYEEQFQLILEDLLALPSDTKIVVEGAALLPSSVAPHLLHPHQGVWLFPAAEFQISHYVDREWIGGVLKHYENPDLAFSNWMARDIGFADEMMRRAERHELASVVVDGARSAEETFDFVTKHFRLK